MYNSSLCYQKSRD